MKNQELFNKTVNILTEAYRNNTLQHGTCAACAVGNIVAANCNYTFDTESHWSRWKESWPHWGGIFCTDSEERTQTTDFPSLAWKPGARAEIESTGYTAQELAKIEYAFETAAHGKSEDEHMLNGLLAVYDILCDIHEVNRNEIKKGEEVFA